MNTAAASTTKPYAGETVVDQFASKSSASRAVRTASKSFYAGKVLDVRVRPSAEWTRIGIDKAEFVVVAVAA